MNDLIKTLQVRLQDGLVTSTFPLTEVVDQRLACVLRPVGDLFEIVSSELRQEFYVYSYEGGGVLTPAGVKCSASTSEHMELLTEFEPPREWPAINMELLAEFRVANSSTLSSPGGALDA